MTIKYWIGLAVAGMIILQIISGMKLFRENRRLSDNLDAVMMNMQYGRTRDSLQTVKTERLLLETSEIKRYFPEITRNIRNLDMKMRQLERYSAVGTSTNYHLSSRLRDTVYVRESVVREQLDTVKLQYIHYKDKWLDFQQAIVADSAYTAIQTRDSISIVQSWERPHKFWFLRWGRKRHTQTVSNVNPHAKITYSIFIEKR